MTHTPCAIQFTDEDHTVEAHVVRDCFGHPEDTLSTLAHLADVVSELPSSPRPGTVAAQFIVIDTLVMGYQEQEPEQLYGDLLALVLDESVKGSDRDLDLLRHHSIEAVESHDGQIWCYEVEVGDKADGWIVRVSGPLEPTAATLAMVFEDVSWQFEGTLADALSELR